MLRKLVGLALVVIAASMVAQAASAAVPQTPATRADGLRLQAEARWYENRPAASYYTPRALRALGERMNAEARYYADASSQRGSGRAVAATVAGGVTAILAALAAAVLFRRRASLSALAGAES